MKTATILSAIGLATLAGCVTLPEEKVISFSNASAKFSVVKYGCVIEEGKYTDVSGNGKSKPFVRLIALANGGETVAEWTGYCDTVIPNGTSRCQMFGPRKAASQCSNYETYRVFW